MEELEAKLPSRGEASHGAPPSFSPTGIDAVVARVAEVRRGCLQSPLERTFCAPPPSTESYFHGCAVWWRLL